MVRGRVPLGNRVEKTEDRTGERTGQDRREERTTDRAEDRTRDRIEDRTGQDRSSTCLVSQSMAAMRRLSVVQQWSRAEYSRYYRVTT